MQRGDQGVNVGAGVVKGQRRTHRRLMAKTAEDRLRTMVTASYRDAIGIESRSNVFIAKAVYNKREHTRLIRRRADQMQTGDIQQKTRSILQQIVFVLADQVQA